MQSFDPFFTNTKLMSHNAAHACFNPTPFSPISPASALVVPPPAMIVGRGGGALMLVDVGVYVHPPHEPPSSVRGVFVVVFVIVRLARRRGRPVDRVVDQVQNLRKRGLEAPRPGLPETLPVDDRHLRRILVVVEFRGRRRRDDGGTVVVAMMKRFDFHRDGEREGGTTGGAPRVVRSRHFHESIIAVRFLCS